MVDFQPLNPTAPWPPLPWCNLIVLCNVMIYFDTDTEVGILQQAADLLADKGYLVPGGAETTFHLVDFFGRAEKLPGGYYRVVRGCGSGSSAGGRASPGGVSGSPRYTPQTSGM